MVVLVDRKVEVETELLRPEELAVLGLVLFTAEEPEVTVADAAVFVEDREVSAAVLVDVKVELVTESFEVEGLVLVGLVVCFVVGDCVSVVDGSY